MSPIDPALALREMRLPTLVTNGDVVAWGWAPRALSTEERADVERALRELCGLGARDDERGEP